MVKSRVSDPDSDRSSGFGSFLNMDPIQAQIINKINQIQIKKKNSKIIFINFLISFI